MSAAGLRALTEAHPHHVTLIESMTGMSVPGTLVAITKQRDTGSFFTGLRYGDKAIVTSMGHDATSDSRSLARVDNDGARLVSRLDESVPVMIGDWDVVEIRACAEAARRFATELVERAYSSANRLLGAPGSDEAALDALRTAKTVRDFAFALGVWADYEEEAERAQRTRKIINDLRGER